MRYSKLKQGILSFLASKIRSGAGHLERLLCQFDNLKNFDFWVLFYKLHPLNWAQVIFSDRMYRMNRIEVGFLSS
jgi:hypothetical protein